MPEPLKSRPELLAPAGDWECLRAAVANGADAVYFGLSRYSARAKATNFTREELPEVIAYLHARNVRGYVAFNTLVFPEELPEAAAFAADIAAAGADAAIVQDLGLARLVRRLVPTLPLHASTQMTLTEPRGIELVRQLGLSRVILARELSTEAIRRIRAATDVPLEVFVHGALCMSYSGQCLASEALWGRSANRGLCGQACRQPWHLIADGRVRPLRDKAYLLSTKDLAAYDRVADLVRLGVAGLKIEGRLKTPAYVAATTQVYRAAIDAAAAGRTFALSDRQQADLAQSYSRGFTHGFLDGTNHRDLVHGWFPKNRGVLVGVVAEKTDRGIVLAIDPAALAGGATIADLLRPGDGLVFDAGRPDESEQGGRVFLVKPHGKAPRLVEVRFGEYDVNLAAVVQGSKVWKTDDPRLRRELEKSYARDEVVRPAPLALAVEAAIDRPLRVRVTDDAGRTAEVASAEPLERAEKRPLTVELLREQFGRLGDTPFELTAIDLHGPGGGPPEPVMAPKSVLNDLRRQAVAALILTRQAAARHAVAEPEALAAMRQQILGRRAAAPESGPPRLYVLVRSAAQLQAVLDWQPPAGTARPAMVYCDLSDPEQHAAAVARCRAAGLPVGLATLRISKPEDEDLLAALADAGPDAALVRHLAGLSFLRERAPALPLVGDFSLNAANDLAADLLAGWGLARVTASLDLNRTQLAALAAAVPPGTLETIVHLHVPLMHMEHCVAAAHLATALKGCGRPCAEHALALRGRVGAEHPLRVDARCRSTLFSGTVQSAAAYLGEMRASGIEHFRVEFLQEDGPQVAQVLDVYARLLAGGLDGDAAEKELAALHPAGLVRGTWDFE